LLLDLGISPGQAFVDDGRCVGEIARLLKEAVLDSPVYGVCRCKIVLWAVILHRRACTATARRWKFHWGDGTGHRFPVIAFPRHRLFAEGEYFVLSGLLFWRSEFIGPVVRGIRLNPSRTRDMASGCACGGSVWSIEIQGEFPTLKQRAAFAGG
jgi:hypothetical protein